MKNKLILLIGIMVAAVLLSYMLMFQVRFDEVAVRASFGSADESSVIKEPGLKFRLPWPFQQIFRYSTRTQMLELGDVTMQTADNYAVVVRVYMAWKIDDPLKFYKGLKDESVARERLAPILRNVSAKIGQFRFNQLVNTDKIELNEIEKLALADAQAELAKADYGVVAEHVGIRRIVLPQDVTEKVFERMKSNRENLAAGVRTRGTAEASAIVSEARGAQRSITSFAEKYAAEIRAKAQSQAAEQYKVFQENPEFAIFLRQLEAMDKIFSGGTSTFIFDANKVGQYNPLKFFVEEPGADNQVPLRPAVQLDADTSNAKTP